MAELKIAVLGPGATGCYLAGVLAQTGNKIYLLGRAKRCELLKKAMPLRLTSYSGFSCDFRPEIQDTAEVTETFDIIFVTVKAHQVASLADVIASASHSATAIVLMQNGIGSGAQLMSQLPKQNFYLGITQFNVVSSQTGVFHKATEGDFWVEDFDKISSLRTSGLQDTQIHIVNNIQAVINGKLLLNLNNALNAIVNIPIKTELQQRSLRVILATAMQEWLTVCRKNKASVAKLTSVPASFVPVILKLPDWLFSLVASKMLAIDPSARSSMWDDIEAGRKTEIEFINQAVVEAGKRTGVATPVNRAIVDCIYQLESKGRSSVDTDAWLSTLSQSIE